jgi:hypothetical protein
MRQNTRKAKFTPRETGERIPPGDVPNAPSLGAEKGNPTGSGESNETISENRIPRKNRPATAGGGFRW